MNFGLGIGIFFCCKSFVFCGFCDLVGLIDWLNVIGIEVFFFVLWMWWLVGEWFGFGGG